LKESFDEMVILSRLPISEFLHSQDPEPTRAAHFCVMHNTVFFNDVVGCSARRQGTPMRRREFITFLGAAAWVCPARAREPQRVIGLLGGGSSDAFPGSLAAFLKGLKDTGFIEGTT
jgi:hypothetical protein